MNDEGRAGDGIVLAASLGALVWALLLALAFPALAAEVCFLRGERTDGLNKICFYECVTGNAAVTIGAEMICPLSIQR